jgi:hypothetical protein
MPTDGSERLWRELCDLAHAHDHATALARDCASASAGSMPSAGPPAGARARSGPHPLQVSQNA